ncbi:MAG: CENPE type kinesin [Trebouxia sp. A1-2]|nr:MAG: CENPE type kinesin [Trebouxia sp. A1-2]
MENISVHVRVRPLNELETEKGATWKDENNKIFQVNPVSGEPVNESPYVLDNIFGKGWSTQQVYEQTTQALIQKVVGGFNSTVFAYGQTSSGKTHTMRGTEEEPGIIPLAVSEIFDHISRTQEREFLLRVSYMELYNEEVHDLLSTDQTKLQIHESKESGIYVAGLREDIVTSAEHVLQLIYSGEKLRHFGETKMNKTSSRSHTIFRMVVESRSRDQSAESEDGGAVWVSTLTLVDLAGSERIAKTGAEGLRMKEGASINKSLLTLGTVINKLSGHIPYRDSKLTRILQPSLGGNAKTAIICNITPAVIHADESHSTLRFACRAKRVVNNAVVNEVLSDAAVLKRQAHEIEELRRMLTGSGNAEIEAQIAHLRAELLHKEQENDRVQLQLTQEKEERERAQRKVDHMTKLMLEGNKDETDDKENRKGNRRETWAPGLAGQRNRKRGLPPKAENSPLEEAEPSGGRKSEPEAVLAVPLGLEAVTPPPQRRKSMADVTNVEAELLKNAAGDPAQVAELQARVKELEMEQSLMQRELDNMSDVAQRTDNQLRAAEDELMAVADEKDKLAPQLEEARWRNRQLEKDVQQLQETSNATEQANQELQQQVDSLQEEAAQKAASFSSQAEGAAADKAALQQELSELSQALKAAESGQADLRSDQEHWKSKYAKLHQDMTETENRLFVACAELQQSQQTLEQKQERMEEAEVRSRDLYDTTVRLEAHIADLESRKRAPLYQKKQEEELKAAIERAQECEIRAVDAEIKYKEAKAARQAAEQRSAELAIQVDKLTEQAVESAADAQRMLDAAVQKAATDLETTQRIVDVEHAVQAAHQEALSNLQAQITAAQEVTVAKEASILEKDGTIADLESRLSELSDKAAGLESAIGEVQACADAASERVQALETQLDAQTSDAEAAAAAAKAELESAQADAGATLIMVKAELKAALAAAETELAGTKEAASTSTAEAQSRLQAAEEAAQAADTAATEAANLAAAKAQEEYGNLRRVLDAVNAQKADLEGKLAKAGGALNAAEELKEARRLHKQELLDLRQQLKTASVSSKGGEKESDRLKKELDKARERLQACEGKLRSAVQDKANVVSEKATIDRQLKALQAQTGKLTKDLDKKESAAEKQRESIMVGFNKTKSELGTLQDALAKTQIDLEKTNFELHAKKSECDVTSGELKEAQRAGAELMQDRDELSAQLASVEQQLADITQAHDDHQLSSRFLPLFLKEITRQE